MSSRDPVSINRKSVMLSITIGYRYAMYSIIVYNIKLLETTPICFVVAS